MENISNKNKVILHGLTSENIRNVVIECMGLYYKEEPIEKIREILSNKYNFHPDLDDNKLEELVYDLSKAGNDFFYTKFTGKNFAAFQYLAKTKKIPDDIHTISAIGRIIENTFMTLKKKDINIMKNFTSEVIEPSKRYIYQTIIRTFRQNEITNKTNKNEQRQNHQKFFSQLIKTPLIEIPISNAESSQKNILYFECRELDTTMNIGTRASFYIDANYFMHHSRRFKDIKMGQSGIICIGIISLIASMFLTYLNAISKLEDEMSKVLMYNIFMDPYRLYDEIMDNLGMYTMKTRKECIQPYLSMNKNSYKLKDDIINKFMKDMLDNDLVPIEFIIKRSYIPPRTRNPEKVVKYIVEANKSNKKIETKFKITKTQSNKPLNPERPQTSKKMHKKIRKLMSKKTIEKKRQRKEDWRQKKLLGNKAPQKETSVTGIITKKAIKTGYRAQKEISESIYKKKQSKKLKAPERKLKMTHKRSTKKR